MIFGGEAFVDLIGEISMMKDLTATMDITMQQMEEEEELAAQTEQLNMNEQEQYGQAFEKVEKDVKDEKPSSSEQPPPYSDITSDPEKPSLSEEAPHPSAFKPSVPGSSATSKPSSGTSTPRRWDQKVIADKSDEEARMDAANMTQEERELRKKEKKKALSREQREKLAALEEERRKQREERVDTLTRKLVSRLSIWTETDKGADVTRAFEEKTRLEVENLKMESFGLEILHAVGNTYVQKATSFLKSQKFLGISGFFSRLKDKGTLAKETWTTISTAIDAQMTMEEMAKLEEKGGEDWTDEKKAEYEKMVTGKILAAAWRGSKFEIQGVLRDVCDKVLYDKSIKLDKRVERAHGLIICGRIFQTVCFPPALLRCRD